MSLIADTIPALYNGVSQQAPMVRAKDQLEGQRNGWSSIAEGLAKRPPTEHIAKLLTTTPTNAMIHEINRDASERYIVIAQSGALRIFDLAGNEQTVTAPQGWGYLASATDYVNDIAMTTVADYTFVVNRKVTVAMKPVGADQVAQPLSNVWINRDRGVDEYGMAYGPGMPAQYDPNLVGVYAGQVQRFDKLPATGTQGDLYAVAGDNTNFFGTYYVMFNGGVWNETVAPNLANAIDEQTMPWALVRQADGTFKFAPFSWMPRRVGDMDSNPNPVFVGRTIRKAFIYQNRLVLLSGETAIMSVTGDLGNFYRTTVVDALDADPISVSATSTKVSIFYDAVPFNDGIMLTSDQTQFSMTNGDFGLSASSMAIKPVTNYEVSIRAGMVAINDGVYFAAERNGYAGIKEYTRLSGQSATSASDITAHVPRYVPAGVRKLIPASDQNALFVLTDGAPGYIYVYQFYWVSGTEKAQSAWHRWYMGDNTQVLSGVYLSGYLYLLLSRGGGVYLERINMQPGVVPSGAPVQVHLDRRVSLTGAYNSSTGRTTFTVPYAPLQSAFQLVRGSSDPTRPGSLIDPSTYQWTTSTQVSVPGNEPALAFGGESYSFKFIFSPVFVRKGDGSAVTTGRLQLKTWQVSFKDTGYFHTEVAPYGAAGQIISGDIIPAKVKDYTGKTVGASDLILNSPLLHTGKFPFQVMGDAQQVVITITNDTHVGSTFLAAEWEGMYFNRARM
ncbi:hypothetical protein EOE18_15295 [Novosphingobium umbonatum]|uniref:Tail tubular protein B n=1 Tax=Novosphingobium umbonatum TaxID=1908524 RepID=A0A3S2UQD0_9SPHN|nr:hypothetical protein [Novosphingobium umbonatum]RVU03486.1 hypothetical protein EOE18_15295 [Novosphingobium umbonatum]